MEKNKVCLGVVLSVLFLLCSNAVADESDIIKADRQALADATAARISSKILAAKEQLSDDLATEADQRHTQAEQKLKDTEDGIIIPLVPDGQGHLLADVLINNGVHASLVVDTGSPVVMLTSSFVQKLNLDLAQSNQGDVEVLNGKYKAAMVSLSSVKLGEAQAQDVPAAVLLEASPGVNDGLLGLSFLSKFHFTLDQAGQRLILKKSE